MEFPASFRFMLPELPFLGVLENCTTDLTQSAQEACVNTAAASELWWWTAPSEPALGDRQTVACGLGHLPPGLAFFPMYSIANYTNIAKKKHHINTSRSAKGL